ncbi:MAG: CHASE3 domain-containing protein [Candidatus Solibacter usitatus]|nr:CHASE3 domain-containing protein [Candidatus Solibacter usitatus]
MKNRLGVGEHSRWRVWVPVWGAAFLLLTTGTLLQLGFRQSGKNREQLALDVRMERIGRENLQFLTDAETAERAYLLTGNNLYLASHEEALRRLKRVHDEGREMLTVVGGTPSGQVLSAEVQFKLDEMAKSIAVFRTNGREAALAVVNTERGMEAMDKIRALTSQVISAHQNAATERTAWLRALIQAAIILHVVGSGSAFWLMVVGIRRSGKNLARSQMLAAELGVQERRYRHLAERLQKGFERGQASMARRVHDEIGGNLTAAKIDLQMGMRRLAQGQEGAQARMETAIALLDRTLRIARDAATEMRPPILDQAGLLAAMEWQLQEFETRSGTTALLSAGDDEPSLSKETKTAFFRVLQEALTNVARHSKATRVCVRTERTEAMFSMSVEDDGVGMEAGSARGESLGILGMQERMHGAGGELEISSAPGKGCRITARAPLEAVAETS